MTERLAAHNLTVNFGKMRAVDDFSFRVSKGEILGIIGPNGAGKTTLFDLLTGTRKPDSGRVLFNGLDVTHASPPRRSRLGIGRTNQIPRPFDNLTVYENALVAAVNGGGRRERTGRDEVHAILNQLGLSSKKDCLARELRLMDRKLLEVARCLAVRPTLLLLDEPAAGLSEQDLRRIVCAIRAIHEKDVSIVWIEHIVTLMTEEVDRLLVMAQGRELVSGPPDRVMKTKEVLDAYLGREDE